MKRLLWTLLALAACGLDGVSCSSGQSINPGFSGTGTGGASGVDAGADGSAGAGGRVGAGGATGGAGGATGGAGGATGGAGGATGGVGSGGSAGSGQVPCGGACPSGDVCGSANGIDVCRAKSGVPRFSHVFMIMMENTSFKTLKSAMNGGGAPNFAKLAQGHATGADYHGVVHPSLPNYMALTSGDTQGISCDCKPTPQALGCNLATCNRLIGTCGCDRKATNIADQMKAAQVSWKAFGEGMGSPCNLNDHGEYAVRHVPFLYYDDIQKKPARCKAHVVDLSSFKPGAAPEFSYIAPDLMHDMHDPFPAGPQNIANGDAWIKPQVDAIMASSAYKQGGLIVVVWDEDDNSGGVLGSDDPIPIFVMSPYAKSGGYVSQIKADHYSLLATLEDGLGLPRLGKAAKTRAGVADTLADYFPAK